MTTYLYCIQDKNDYLPLVIPIFLYNMNEWMNKTSTVPKFLVYAYKV
jgi:hypothetical protein